MNTDIIQTIAFTGHRINKLTAKETQVRRHLAKIIQQAIDKDYTHFVTGMALGVDTWAAELVLQQESVTLTAVLPMVLQDAKWSAKQTEKYLEILEKSHNIFVVNENRYITYEDLISYRAELIQSKTQLQYYEAIKCLHARNQWMVDNCHCLVAIWDEKPEGGTYNCVKYALSVNKRIVIYNPFTNKYKIHRKIK